MYCKLNVILIRQLIQGIKCLVYKMASLKSLGKALENKQKILWEALPFGTNQYHTVPLGTMQYHLLFVLFYRILIECPKPFYIGFLSYFFIQTIPCFVRQIVRDKLWIPDKKYYVNPWTHLMFLKLFFQKLSKWSACELLVEVLL